jgi:hypothetical protein
VDDVVPLSVKTVKVNPGDDGADSQVNLLERISSSHLASCPFMCLNLVSQTKLL